MSWQGWKSSGKPRRPNYDPPGGGRKDDRYGNKGRSWEEDDGGTGSTREMFTTVSNKGPGRTRDVVEHARQVQKDLSSKGMEKKRQAEEKDHADYINQLQHRVLDHLADWEGEDYLSSFMCQVHVDDRAYHTSQKAIKNFVEEYLDDVVEVFRSPGEANGQYSFRMRTVEKGKGKNHGKRDDQRPSKSRRRGGRGRSNTPEEEDEPAYGTKVHVANLNYDTAAWQLEQHIGAFFETKSCRIKTTTTKNGSERSRGWGVVEFFNGEDARQAIEWYHDTTLDGRMLAMKEYQE